MLVKKTIPHGAEVARLRGAAELELKRARGRGSRVSGAVTQPLDASAPELTRCAAKQSNADRDATSRDHCRASLAVRGRSSHAAPRAKKYNGGAPVGQVQFQFQEDL